MNITVVYCHPNPQSLVAAALDRVLAGLIDAGHTTRLIDLYAEGFEPEMTADERREHASPGVESSLAHHADALGWAEALVFVYPTWWGGQPAMLKGWIDRVWVAGVAWELPDGANILRPLLTNIGHILVVTTHGSSKVVNAVQGEPGKRVMTRAIRAMCSKRTRTTWCAMYGLGNATDDERTKFLDRVQRTAAKL